MEKKELVDLIYVELGFTEGQISKDIITIMLGDMATFDRKQHDYGSGNIAAFGEKGVLVRMNDKMARLRNLVWNDKASVNESIDDSYLDISVYGAIARMCRSGKWPKS